MLLSLEENFKAAQALSLNIRFLFSIVPTLKLGDKKY